MKLTDQELRDTMVEPFAVGDDKDVADAMKAMTPSLLATLPPRTCPACRRPIDECERIREDCTAEAIGVYETACALANIGTGVLIAHLCSMLGAVSTRLTDAEWVTCSDRRKHEIKTMRDLERSLIRIYDAAMVKP